MDEQQSTNNTVKNIASALDSSSYSAHCNYKENDISNLIQLVHMYQTKNDINAYEYMLRESQELIEDCNFQKKQLLLSMIPSPSNVPDHMIKEVFHTTTGFVKLNIKENNIFENIFNAQDVDEITDNASKQSFLNDKNTLNFKPSLSEAFPFRGFSKSEISMIPNHANLSNNYLNDNSKDWLEKNNKYQMSSYQQYLFNKKYYIPTKINMCNTIDGSHLCYSSQTKYQDTNVCNKTEIMNLWQNKISRQFNDTEFKKYEKTINDKKFSIPHVIIDIGKEGTTKETIKNDIYKMDVCWDEDQNIVINADDFLPVIRDKLKTSLCNFLKRAQEEIFVDLSPFPRVRLHSQIGSLNTEYFKAKRQKSEISSKVLKQDIISSVSNSKSNWLFLRQHNYINADKNHKKLSERTKQEADDNRLQNQYNSQEFNKVTDLQSLQDNLDCHTKKKETTFEYKEKKGESNNGNEIIKLKPDNSNNRFEAHSIYQLVAYKKRYYDTLLNIQRAKVAISNSLMASSDYLTAYDNPYYSNYMCQQQHLLQQQRRLMMRSQFSTCSADLCGLSNVHYDQYSWAKSICKYLLLKQLRLQRQVDY